jgi:hypothetical protein
MREDVLRVQRSMIEIELKKMDHSIFLRKPRLHIKAFIQF